MTSGHVAPCSPDEQGARSLGELQRVETVLFTSGEPAPLRRVAHLAGLPDASRARALIRRLNEGYQAAGAAFLAEEVAGGWQLRTRAEYAPWLQRRHRIRPQAAILSQPMLETLAVAAYRQPVARAEIEAIRGVRCGEVLKQLLEADYLRIAGRGEELGRPYLYATTKKFLESFGLRSVRELPQVAGVPHGGADSEKKLRPGLDSKDE